MIGFSRGAFTARSIATLIRSIGLLNRQGLVYFYQIFQDWHNQLNPNWRSPYPDEPWENRPAPSQPEYLRKLLELELTRPHIPIKAIGVWDTVGGESRNTEFGTMLIRQPLVSPWWHFYHSQSRLN